MSRNHSVLAGKLPNISLKNFKTLGAGAWLDDEVINYFVTKWCSRSTTLGLSTFFACKILFDDTDNACIQAKRGPLSSEDAKRAQRWCHRSDVRCLPSFPEAPP